MGIATDCIHAGQEPEEVTGAVTVPIFQTSTYVQPELGRHKGFEYARTQNPTRAALETLLATLEKGRHGHCFASGMAAIDTVMKLLSAGDHVITGEDMYGGSFRLMDKVYRRFGVEFSHVDTTDLEKIEAAIRPNTKILYLETPTNPMMRITDLGGCTNLVKNKGVIVVVDNTFASPYFQRPIELGADIVVHSTTKYLNGHSDSVGGVVVTTRDDHAERIGFLQNAAGGILSPFDSFLVTRGVKTLAVRMERHNANGIVIARYLVDHPKVQKVNYPGLPSHPQHALAKKQMSGFGGMISFELGSHENAKTFLDRVRLCSLGESLGGVETLISHPASMTHGSVPEETRQRLGITPGLVRISVGIEDVEDLVADLDNAFAGL